MQPQVHVVKGGMAHGMSSEVKDQILLFSN
jgi:hypothetical protein